MLTKEGCRTRLTRLTEALGDDWDAILIHLPEHLLYFGNYIRNYNSLNLQSYAYLLVERGGGTTLFVDNWPAAGVGQDPIADITSADQVDVTDWYTCEGPAVLRGAAVAEKVAAKLRSLGVERLAAETAHLPFAVASEVKVVRDIEVLIRKMRETKDADEIEAIRRGVRTAEAVHAASRELLRPGITELEYYSQLVARATPVAGCPFVMMCDLASGSRAAQGGGNPTDKVINEGELVILDIFPYVEGYRGDITNTLVCGGKPTAEQSDHFELVLSALEAAEALIRPETPVSEFYQVIVDLFAANGAELPHHAGHAIGLGHPEAPELVPNSDREIAAGMVLTLEPGCYGRPTGGIRVEHDYLVTPGGFERLSDHRLSLD